MDKLYKRFAFGPLLFCAFVIPNLRLSGIYSEGDPQVFSLLTSDEKRFNYRLTSTNPEGVVVIKPESTDNEGKNIFLYATNDEERFKKVSDPVLNNQLAVDKYRLTGLSDPSILAIIKTLISEEKYNSVGYKADMSIKELAAIIGLLDEANRVREGISSVDAATSFKIEQLLASKDFLSEHRNAMGEYKIVGCITSQRIKQVTRADTVSEGAPRSPRFLAR